MNIEKREKISCLLGDLNSIRSRPVIPFSDTTMAFLEKVSEYIRNLDGQGGNEGLRTFGFWCRRQHLMQLKKAYGQDRERLGLGMIFHIAPSNVPGLFAWSAAIGLLAGNSNLVRVSERKKEETERFCTVIGAVLERPEFKEIKERLTVISYPKEEQGITQGLSQLCDGRIVWGGDDTIRAVRKCTMNPYGEEIVFPDRLSAAMIHCRTVVEITEEEIEKQADNFYKDTYSMDQNACSSPSLILWLEDEPGEAMEARKRWWAAVAKRAGDYSLSEKQAYEKYRQICSLAIRYPVCQAAECYGNVLYTLFLSDIPEHVEEMRGNSGLFLECMIKDRKELKKISGKKTQTLTFFGVERKELVDFFIQSGAKGIDRIVPMGQAMEMDLTWDGKNLIERLSRKLG